jgi:hypothetical protein
MYRKSFKVTQEVNIDVAVQEVIDNLDHDELFNALMEEGYDISGAISDMECDEVMDCFQHHEIVSWAASNIDTDEMLDALKRVDAEGVASWLEKNDDLLSDEKKQSIPAPTPVVRPVVSMNEGRILVAGRADSLEPLSVFDAGTYTTFGGVIAVTALGVQFMTTAMQSAEAILGAVAFAQANQENK